MRNLLIVLLTVVIVVMGALLPQFLLGRTNTPALDTEYQQLSITSEDSSDYAWRLEMVGDHYYADRSDLMSSYISGAFNEEQLGEMHGQFERQLEELTRKRILSTKLLDEIRQAENYTINCFYIFDTKDLAGFRIAVMNVSGTGWSSTITMDMESGKLARLELTREAWKNLPFRPESVVSWYDTLRSFADYLGLAQTEFQLLDQDADTTEYYEKITQDRLSALVAGSPSWVETRVLQNSYTTTLCVFQGGR